MAQKKNKTAIVNEVTTTVAKLCEENSSIFKAGKMEAFQNALTVALFNLIGPKTGGGMTDKVNENGEVYCNYFGAYFPADDFNKKTDGKFKANSAVAEKILRKIKNLRASVERGATAQLRAGAITQEKWFEVMDRLDVYVSRKFNDVSEIVWNEVTPEEAE